MEEDRPYDAPKSAEEALEKRYPINVKMFRKIIAAKTKAETFDIFVKNAADSISEVITRLEIADKARSELLPHMKEFNSRFELLMTQWKLLQKTTKAAININDKTLIAKAFKLWWLMIEPHMKGAENAYAILYGDTP